MSSFYRLPSTRKAIIVTFVLISAVLFADRILMGPYAPIRLSDTFDTVFPEIRAYGQNFRDFGNSLWFPNVAGGRPTHVFHFGPFHPFNILSAFMPIWLIYSLLVIILPPVAGYGMWRLLRDFFRLPDDISLFGGILFLIGSLTQPFHLVVEIFNYVFPLFFMWSVVDDYPHWRARCVGVASLLSVSLFSLPVLTLPEFCIIQFLMIIFLASTQTWSVKRMVLRWFCIWVAYFLLFLPVIYALFNYKELSQRAVLAPYTHPFLRQIINIVQEGSIKSGVFCLLAGALVFFFRSQRIRKIVLIWAIISVLAAIDSSSLSNVYRNTFLAHLEFSQLQFTMAPLFVIIAMLGLNELRECPTNGKLYACFGIIAIFWLAKLYAWAPWHNLFWLNIFIPVFIFVYIFRNFLTVNRKTAWLTGKWVFMFCFIMSLFFVRIYRFSGYSMEDTPYSSYFRGHSLLKNLSLKLKRNPGRVCSIGFFHTLAENYGLETTDYYSSIFYGPYREYWKKIIDNQLENEGDKSHFERYYYEVTLLNGSLKKRFNASGERFDEDLKLNIPMLLATNTTHVISSIPIKYLDQFSTSVYVDGRHDQNGSGIIETFLNRVASIIPRESFKLIPAELPKNKDTLFSPVPIWIYELDKAFERGYLAENAIILNSGEDVLFQMSGRSVVELKKNVFFDKHDVGDLFEFEPADPTNGQDSKVELLYYEPDRLTYKVKADRPSFLVVSNCFHPNWHATINEKPTNVLKANHCFQAIQIPQSGEYKIELEYKDKLVWVMYASFFVVVLLFYGSCCIRICDE